VIDDKPRNPNYSTLSISVDKPEKTAFITSLEQVTNLKVGKDRQFSPPTQEKSTPKQSAGFDNSAILSTVQEVRESKMTDGTPLCPEKELGRISSNEDSFDYDAAFDEIHN
jgi:hypothetical protein